MRWRTAQCGRTAIADISTTVAQISTHIAAPTVTVVSGDAFKEIPGLQGDFDLVFLDAWKPDYRKFFDLVFPRLAAGGVFVAHNVVNKKDEMEPFLDAIETHPSLFTTIVSPSSEGMSVSYKVR